MELASSSCSALAIILLFVAHAVFPVESVIPFPFGIDDPLIEDLTVTPSHLDTVSIKWSSILADNQEIEESLYTLYIQDLNNTWSHQRTQLTNLSASFYRSHAEPCNYFRFAVSVELDLNDSNQTFDIAVSHLPSRPNLSPIERSFEHIMEMAPNGVNLTVVLSNLSKLCPNDLPHAYTLVVEDEDGIESGHSTSAPLPNDTEVTWLINLPANNQYTYYVTARNEYASSNRTPAVTIYATNVREINICREEGTDYSIQCLYLNPLRSQVRGCFYVLVNGEETVAGVIGIDVPEAVITREFPVFDFDHVFVFDYQNGTIQDIPIVRNISVIQRCSETRDPFTMQPDADPFSSRAILGMPVQLVCAVHPRQQVGWSILHPTETEAINTISASETEHQLLESWGISVSLSDLVSTLIINGTRVNNQTVVQCLTQLPNRVDVVTAEQRVDVLFYDSSQLLSSLTVSGNGLGSVMITWRSPFRLNFTVTVTNLDDPSTGPMEVSGIQDQHYIFTTEESSPCDSYLFEVSTLLSEDPSGSRVEDTASIPSRPYLSSLEDTLEHRLELAQNGVHLTVVLSNLCPSRVPHIYTLVVEDEGGGVRARVPATPAANGSTVTWLINDLMGATQYLYYVIATNENGDRQTANVTIPVTDVQSISICPEEGTNQYFIQCSYLETSMVAGCVYVLVNRSMEGNITGTIERSNVVGISLVLPVFFDYVLVFDLEEDSNVSTIPIFMNFSSFSCRTLKSDDVTTITGIAVGIGLLVIIVGAIVCIACVSYVGTKIPQFKHKM